MERRRVSWLQVIRNQVQGLTRVRSTGCDARKDAGCGIDS